MKCYIISKKIVSDGLEQYKLTDIKLPVESQLTQPIRAGKNHLIMLIHDDRPDQIEIYDKKEKFRYFSIGDIVSKEAYAWISRKFYECMELYSSEIDRVRRLKEDWNGEVCMSANLTSKDTNVEYRDYNGIPEHKHEDYEWWHPISRIHKRDWE